MIAHYLIHILVLCCIRIPQVFATVQATSLSTPLFVAQVAPERNKSLATVLTCDKACTQLAAAFPSQVFLGKDGEFNFWDRKQENIRPACRMEPLNPEDIAQALQVVKEIKCNFAVKSGGHSRSAGSSNAAGGVTLDLAKMDRIELSSDRKSVKIGAGARWRDVYAALEPEKLTVLGGRVADVGVGGLLLGGGISFFSARHGLACDSILSYDLVLPSSEISSASEHHKQDLYQALRGAGSTNFGIVTSFTLETLPLPNPAGMWWGTRSYSWDKMPELIQAHHKFLTESISADPDLGELHILIYYQPQKMLMVGVHHSHTSHPLPTLPKSLAHYANIEPLPDSENYRIMPMLNVTYEIDAASPYGMRNSFASFTHKPSTEFDEKVVKMFEAAVERLKNIEGVTIPLVTQPISKRAIEHMTKRGGNSLALKPEDGPLVIFLTAFVWKYEADDTIIVEVGRQLIEDAEALAKEMRIWHPFKYINYAEEWQDPYEGYGEENLRKLKAVQRKYDPERIFTKGGLASGYFKLNRNVDDLSLDRDEL